MSADLTNELIRAHYEDRVVPGRDSYDILDWGSSESQLSRFHVLVDILIRHQIVGSGSAVRRLLDVGCGLSDLCTLLESLKLGVEYVGVDIVPGILAEARRRHPGRNLLLADLISREPFPPRSFAAAFCSGTFNLEVGNNEEFARRACLAILPLVEDCLVANFLHVRARDKYPHCHYYNPEKLMAALNPHVKKIDCRDDYLENDFTLVLWP